MWSLGCAVQRYHSEGCFAAKMDTKRTKPDIFKAVLPWKLTVNTFVFSHSLGWQLLWTQTHSNTLNSPTETASYSAFWYWLFYFGREHYSFYISVSLFRKLNWPEKSWMRTQLNELKSRWAGNWSCAAGSFTLTLSFLSAAFCQCDVYGFGRCLTAGIKTEKQVGIF